MSKSPVYIGLDMATTTGIAVYHPEVEIAWCYLHKGTPIELADKVGRLITYVRKVNIWPTDNITFAVERLHLVRNMNTVRSLLERYGYIKYNLLAAGYEVLEYGPLPPRKFLGKEFTTKEEVFTFMRQEFKGPLLTSNHTDALAQALYAAHKQGFLPEPVMPKIEVG